MAASASGSGGGGGDDWRGLVCHFCGGNHVKGSCGEIEDMFAELIEEEAAAYDEEYEKIEIKVIEVARAHAKEEVVHDQEWDKQSASFHRELQTEHADFLAAEQQALKSLRDRHAKEVGDHVCKAGDTRRQFQDKQNKSLEEFKKNRHDADKELQLRQDAVVTQIMERRKALTLSHLKQANQGFHGLHNRIKKKCDQNADKRRCTDPTLAQWEMNRLKKEMGKLFNEQPHLKEDLSKSLTSFVSQFGKPKQSSSSNGSGTSRHTGMSSSQVRDLARNPGGSSGGGRAQGINFRGGFGSPGGQARENNPLDNNPHPEPDWDAEVEQEEEAGEVELAQQDSPAVQDPPAGQQTAARQGAPAQQGPAAEQDPPASQDPPAGHKTAARQRAPAQQGPPAQPNPVAGQGNPAGNNPDASTEPVVAENPEDIEAYEYAVMGCDSPNENGSATG